MAPSAAPAPLTPNPVDGYAALKTPDVANDRHANKRPSTPSSLWTNKHWYLGTTAQVLAVACIGLYIFGQLAYAMPVYWIHLKVTITSWWSDHSEMVRPTFLFLFCILPFVASLLLIEFARTFHTRRITSRAAMHVARVLRRKPSACGVVSRFSLGELLFLALVVGGNVWVFYHSYTRRYNSAKVAAHKSKKPIATKKYFDMVGNSLGFNCLLNLAFLFVPATRNAAWMDFLNISYANGVQYHRWLGVATVVTALAHCITYYWAWIRDHKWTHEALPCFNCSLQHDTEGHDRWVAVTGELALLCFLAISVSSIPLVRRKCFNVFYYTHQLSLFAVVFIGFHWGGAIWFIAPTVFAYLFQRVVSRSNARTAVQVTECTALSNSSFVKLVVARSPSARNDFVVGQFVYLNVPAISKLQWHPFTIASSPHAHATTLTLIMKALGDWTTDLVAHSEQCQRDNVLPVVYMDGYYGASLELYDEYATVCLIGGGIGVTPLLAMLDDMVAKLSHHEVPTQRVFFVFSFRELALLEEIHPMLCKIKELDPQEQFFQLIFSLTEVPTEARLDERIDRRQHDGPTHHAATTQQQNGNIAVVCNPFVAPLQSRALKSLALVTLFSLFLVLLVVLSYGGGKIDGDHDELWLVQNGVEIALVFVCAAFAYGVVLFERRFVAATTSMANTSNEKDIVAMPLTPMDVFSTDVHTFRDLVAQYNVAVGQRPDLEVVLRDLYSNHEANAASNAAATTSAIGVFVSGPQSLKRSVESAVAAIGTSKFDIHAEEFEL